MVATCSLSRFFNAANEFLAALLLDTSEIDYGIWRDDGNEAVHTDEVFLADFLHRLRVDIDLLANQWSVELDDIPVFEDQPFTATEASRNVGGVAAEWHINDVSDPGNNWLLFDNWALISIGEEPSNSPPTPDASFRITHISMDAIPSLRLEWPAVAGVTYQIESSVNGINWQPEPGSQMSTSGSNPTLSHTIPIASTESRRFYRVVWLGMLP